MIPSSLSPYPTETMLFADVYTAIDTSAHHGRGGAPSDVPLITAPLVHEYRLPIDRGHPCHAVIVGRSGVGKSTMLDVWAWRLMEVGVHVLVLGSGRNQHTSLCQRAQQAGYATVHYPDAITGMFDGHAALTVIAMRDDATYVPLATVVKLITHDRQHSRAPRAPLVVMLDDVALDPAGRMALMQAMRIWPALDLSLWMVVCDTRELVAAVVPQQPSWMDTALRVWFCPDTDARDMPIGAQAPRARTVMLWPPHQSCVRGQVGPRTAREQYLVTARPWQCAHGTDAVSAAENDGTPRWTS